MITSGMQKTEMEELTAEITSLGDTDGNKWATGNFE